MIKAAETPCYLFLPHTVSIWNVDFFGAFYLWPVVSAVTMGLLVTEVIKTCVSHAKRIVSLAADIQS